MGKSIGILLLLLAAFIGLASSACKQNSPGNEFVSNVYCDRNKECKCWEMKAARSINCDPQEKRICSARGGYCYPGDRCWRYYNPQSRKIGNCGENCSCCKRCLRAKGAKGGKGKYKCRV